VTSESSSRDHPHMVLRVWFYGVAFIPTTMMKSALALLSLASIVAASPVAPNDAGSQLRMGVDQILAETAENVFGDVFRGVEHILDTVLHTGEDTVHKVEGKLQEWTVGNTEFVKQDDIVCEYYGLVSCAAVC
jgi:hypothetical protein